MQQLPTVSQYLLKSQKNYLLESLFQYQGLAHREHQASSSVTLSLGDLSQLSHLFKRKNLIISTNTWISQTVQICNFRSWVVLKLIVLLLTILHFLVLGSSDLLLPPDFLQTQKILTSPLFFSMKGSQQSTHIENPILVNLDHINQSQNTNNLDKPNYLFSYLIMS